MQTAAADREIFRPDIMPGKAHVQGEQHQQQQSVHEIDTLQSQWRGQQEQQRQEVEQQHDAKVSTAAVSSSMEELLHLQRLPEKTSNELESSRRRAREQEVAADSEA